ncbi:DUF2281 domain-containing protein [Candidatus Magnetominusculus dajiuhuensis]|uniref:DUF2281 domain-containing protein n=1 Tax=Candidatus Magnetominusculus dajiuhuensis TaxID=3137712 RepID=UPI003B42A4D9
MDKKEQLISELEQVPEAYISEVLDFIHLLKSKSFKDGMAVTAASEAVLSKGWLRPEEDDAWRNL